MQKSKKSMFLRKVCAIALAVAVVGGSAAAALPVVGSTGSGIVASAAETSPTKFQFAAGEDGLTITGFTGDASDVYVVIPSQFNGINVTEIGWSAFYNNLTIQTVTIPNSVKTIGYAAFYESGLTSVTVPDSVTEIGERVFNSCKDLKTFKLPDSMTYISHDMFMNTQWYQDQPAGAVYIGKNLYDYKDDIRDDDGYYDDDHGYYDDDGFYYYDDDYDDDDTGYTDRYAAETIEPVSVVIKDDTISISDNAFHGKSYVVGVTIPDSVKIIGESAFASSGIHSITIPKSVSVIPYGAFYGCSNLENVTISDSVITIGANAFTNCGSLASVSIPKSARTIENEAFLNCEKLNFLTIPESVTEIGEYAVGYMRYYRNDWSTEYTYDSYSNFSIFGATGSKAAEYAEDNEFSFIQKPDAAVTNKPTAISFSESDLTLEKNSKYQLNVTITPVNAADTTLLWKSSDPTVASVDEKGNVTAVGAGTAFIKAETFNGLATEIVVFVTDAESTTEPDPEVSEEPEVPEDPEVLEDPEVSEVTPAPVVVKTALKTVTLKPASYIYDGKAKTPAVTVTDTNGKTVNKSNYDVQYNNNINAGTATVTVTAKGNNYTGRLTKSFTISKASIATVSLPKTSYTYTGSQRKPAVTVKDASGKTISASNYTVKYTGNTNKGTATVTVTGKGDYTGTAKTKFTIKAKSTANLTTKLSAASYVYNGKAKKPTVTVKDGTKTLKKDTDYTVTYKSNTKPGKATVTIKGKGNYSGTITKTFTIKPKKATLKTATSPKTKQLKATWTKDTTATGYQIQYSTNSKFKSGNKTKLVSKNSTTSATIKNLTKGKTYYVRICAYKTVGKTKVFGGYSTVKKVKIK